MSRLAELKKKYGETSGQDNNSYKSRLDKLKEQSNNSTYGNAEEFNKFVEDYTAFINSAKSDYESVGYGNASSLRENYTKTASELRKRLANFSIQYNLNRSDLTDEEKEMSKYINEIKTSLTGIENAFGEVSDHYSQWKTEDEYNQYLKQVEEYEKKTTYDLDASQKELDSLKDVYSRMEYLQNRYNKERNEGVRIKISQDLKALYEQYGDYKTLGATIKEKETYHTDAKRIQKGIELSSVNNPESEYYDPNFENYLDGQTSLDKEIKDILNQLLDPKLTVTKRLELKALLQLKTDELEATKKDNRIVALRGEEGEKIKAQDTFARGGGISIKTGDDTEDVWFAESLLEEEVDIYTYYLNKYGEEKAEAYLNSIRDTVTYRNAQKTFESVEDNLFLEAIAGVAAGLDQFRTGMAGAIGMMFEPDEFKDSEYPSQVGIPTTEVQYLSGMVREDLGDVGVKLPEWMGGASIGQVGYDMITTTSNMLPSILISYAVPGAGAALGSIVLGASATGNAYNEMRKLGYDKNQARTYGLLVGVSEAGLQYALGGISKLGGKATKGLTELALSKVDNAFARFAIQYGSSMLSEGFEEGLQTALEPFFKSLVGMDFEAPDASEVIYSALLGAMSAGLLEGGGLAINEVNTYKQGADIKNLGTDSIYKLAEIGKGFDEKSAAYRLGNKVNDKSGAYTIGRLLSEVGESMSEQNRADIVKLLEAEGMNTNEAKKSAKWLEKALNEDYKLNRGQLNQLNNNEIVAKLYNEVITNADSDINKRKGGLESLLKDVEVASLKKELAKRKDKNQKVADEELDESLFGDMDFSDDEDFADDDKIVSGEPVVEEPVHEAEPIDKVSAKTTDGNDVEVEEIASINDGEITLKLKDGNTIKAKEVEYGDEKVGILYENVLNMGLNAELGNVFIRGYEPSEGLTVEEYTNGFKEAFKYGEYNYSIENMSKEGFSASLSETTKKLAYEAGRINAKYKIDKNVEALKDKKVDNYFHKDSMSVDEAKKTKGLTERQSKSIDVIQKVYDALGIKVRFFESPVVNGKRKGENGRYDTKTGTVYLDLYAGLSGEGTILYTASHELTHFIEQWSPAKFKAFADVIVSKLEAKGISVDELVSKQIEKAKKSRGEDISYDTAFGEVIADSCESFLAEGDTFKEIASEVSKKDKKLGQKILDFFNKLFAKIKSLYQGLSPNSFEGQYVANMLDSVDEIRKMWAEALVDASETFNTIGSRNLEDFDGAKNEDGENLFQYRAMEADEETYKDMLRKWGKMSDEQINNLFTTIDKAMDIIKQNLEILDYAWEQDIDDRTFSPVKANSDKLYQVSLDFSTLCRKRILQQTIQVQLQEALNKPLTKEEGIAIRDALMSLQEEGRQIEVACALCYVESARMKSPDQIKKFVANREDVLKEFFAGKSGGDIKTKIKQAEDEARERLGVGNESLKSLPKNVADEIRSAKKQAKKSYSPTAEEQSLIDKANSMTVADFTSPEGLENLAKNYPRLFDAYTSYIRNATKSKGIENDVWWRAGDSSSIGDVLIANMNKENGLRSQSWSDFQVIHILDYIASTIELATRNTKEQAYSKVPDYVELMGNTGVMINMSLIPTAKFDGKLDYDSVEGIAYKRALELREKYHKTAGTICIGINNKQIVMLLEDNTIDYVIPYHHSGMSKATRKLMHIPTWDSYELYQNETKLSRAEAEKQAKKYGVKLLDASDPNYQKGTTFSEWFDLREAQQITKLENANPTDKAKQKKYGVMYGGYMAMQNAGNNYLKLCAERGLAPKFSHTKADFTTEDNYWKLLIDRKMIDNVTGEIIEQQTIKPIFNEGEIMRILNDELERYPQVKADQDYAAREVAEKFLSGKVKGGMSAEAIAKVMKKPVDNVTNVNILESAKDLKLSDRNWENVETIQGLDGYSVDEVIDITKSHIQSVLEEYGEYAEIVAIRPLGSRAKGTAKADSDLDIVVQYEGDIREDDMFNMLNDEDSKLYIEGIEVDINPIRADESGDIEDYLGRVYDFDKYNETKYSDRDSIGNELSKEQQEFFKDSKVRDKKGNLLVVYHGTKAQFNTFTKGDIGFHFGTKGAARGRVGTGKNVTIKEVYLNITNPIVFDEDLGSWDADYRLTQELFERGILTRDEAEQILLSDDKTYRRPTEKANKKLREMLLQKGYDGIEYRNTFESKKDSTSYIAFNSNQVKEISNQNPTPSADIRYSDRADIVDVNGKEYDHVIELDYKTFNKIKRDGKAYIDFIRNNLINKKITVHNSDGETEIIEFARVNERVKKEGSDNFRRVLGELEQARNPIKKLVITNAQEVAEISQIANHNSTSNHQWLDANGWDDRTSYVMTKDGIIYPTILHIAKAKDGRSILYDVTIKIKEGIGIDKNATSLRAKKNAEQAVKVPKPSDELYHKDDDLSRGKNVKLSDRDFPNNAEDIAKEYFGTTNKWSETGFLTKDGTQLDFSGRHWRRHPEFEVDLADSFFNGKRDVEHFEIVEAFSEYSDVNDVAHRGEILNGFLSRGNIRIVGNGIVELYTVPTEEQFEKLLGYFKENNRHSAYVGIGTKDGLSFPSGTSASTIIEAIRDYFEKGRSNQSDLMKFHTKYSDRDSYAPTFYSYMGKVVDGIKIEKMGAGGVVSYLKGKGVKNEEIKWSGIETWLEGKKSVTKAELQEFIAGSQLQIQEQSSSNDIDLRYNAGESSYSLYDDAGNIIDTYTYNEFLGAYVSHNDEEIYSNAVELEDALREEYGSMSSPRWTDYKLDGGSNYRELVFTMPNSSYTNSSMQAHWGQDAEGVLAHARIQDFDVDGKKMLFIEEIQSDWHNEGHQEGYVDKKRYKQLSELESYLHEEYMEERNSLIEELSKVYEGKVDNPEAAAKTVLSFREIDQIQDFIAKKYGYPEELVERIRSFKNLKAEYNRVSNEKIQVANGVPDAPFRNNYHEYVLKRLLRMAAEEGYDSIGWTTADIQSKRWSDEYAEGYRIEYDQDIPSFLKKYGKKWGAKVGDSYIRTTGMRVNELEERLTEIERYIESGDYTGDDIEALTESANHIREKLRGTKVWSMDITDSMKESVLYEGQVLYSERVTDKETLDFLNRQIERGEYITVYRSFQVIDGGLYAPMNAVDRDEDGKNKRLGYRSELGKWEKATESQAIAQRYMDSHPDAPYAKFDLDGGDNKTGGVAYNPYLHASNLVLNDQFAAAYRRNLVTVECRVPLSEAGGAYKADYAKDGTGWAEWKAGGVAGQLKKIKPDLERKLFLSRYMLPVKILSDAEVASMYKEYLGDTNIPVPWNVVTPTLRKELEKVGVNISYKDVKQGSGILKFADKFPEETSKIRYQDRDSDGVSNRTLLANALESVAQNDIERNKLKQYKEKIALIESEQAKLSEINAQIRTLSFAKGKRDTYQIKSLQFEANQCANRINTYDRQLLNLESTKALKGVLEREKKLAYDKAKKEGKDAVSKQREKDAKTVRELMNRYQESRKKGIESRNKTALRRDIHKKIKEISSLLNHGNKKRNVKEDMKDFVSVALRSAEILFSDDIKKEDIIRNGFTTDLTPKEMEIADKCYELLLKRGEAEADGDIARITEWDSKLKNQMQKLSDAFVRERARLNKVTIDNVLSDLAKAYKSLETSKQEAVQGAYSEELYEYLMSLQEEVDGTIIKDMSLDQLEKMKKVYTMVLTKIRQANSLFADNIKESRIALGNKTLEEFIDQKKDRTTTSRFVDWRDKYTWNNEKPIYAFERLGSATLKKLFGNVLKAEDVWAKNVKEASEFSEDMKKKYKYNSWDFNKMYKFTTSYGLEVEVNLEQLLSLYAFSKREQAKDHLEKGGFVFGKNTEVVVKKNGIKRTYLKKTAKAHNVAMSALDEVLNGLTTEQKTFADEMQKYLSDVMGAKGNEVSMALYGVELFKEKFYFPLKSAGQFNPKAKEADAKAEQGKVRIVNAGFSKETVKHANNPIILEGFMDVWASHVNEMAMYHAFVLPLEDFRKVYSFKTQPDSKLESMSVISEIQNHHGDAATQYIDQLYDDINGGARSDSRESIAKAMISKFKKASTFLSLSVLIQQPTSIVRALSLIDAKHFVGKRFGGKHGETWEEVKKYAPVAIIKDMGYFDTNVGKSTSDFIKGTAYTTFKEKAKAFFSVKDSSYRDEKLSKLPALADELAWCSIWKAVKRETLASNPGMDVNSEAFLTKCGERFTDIIKRTQVYDSVLSRSANMRSKHAYMNMLTSFLAEPTTSINMAEDAIRKGKHGDKKYMARTLGAVAGSIMLNAALSSLVYAMRDDDEDETMLEKYMQSFTTELFDGLNPITYLPFFKDGWSILQGFDVERADMTLIDNLADSLQEVTKLLAKDTSNMSEEDLIAHHKSVNEAMLGILDHIGSLAGIPSKNIRRELDGIINTIKNFASGDQTTGLSLGNAMVDAIKDSTPIWGWLPNESKTDKLYEALTSGDKAYLDRIKKTYKSDSAYTSAIRSALKDNDSRIMEVAQARYEGDTSKYTRIAKEIIAEGNFSQDIVVGAINSAINDLKKGEVSKPQDTTNKVTSIYNMDDYFNALDEGSMASSVKEAMIQADMANGKDRDEAEANFNSQFTSVVQEEYEAGNINGFKAVTLLMNYGGKTEESASSKIQYWDFKKQYPNYDLSESAVNKYYTEVEPSGITVDVYYDYSKQRSKCTGTDYDGDGKTDSGSVKAEVLRVINSLPISSYQKDVLYRLNGWSDSTLWQAPWH